jgi:putative Mn2+ efflux pump MntP
LTVLWLSAVLIAAVSNLDNLAVGVAFGLRDSRIGARANLVIAGVTMAGTALAMSSGRALSQLLPLSLASALGAAIIIAIGAGTVAASLYAVVAPQHPPAPTLFPQVTRGEGISLRAALPLAAALSLNNVGSGVGAGVAGVPPLTTTVLAGVFSLLCVGGGSRAGLTLGRIFLGRRAPLSAGLVLLAVGVATLCGAG